jgi:hypothetical protein
VAACIPKRIQDHQNISVAFIVYTTNNIVDKPGNHHQECLQGTGKSQLAGGQLKAFNNEYQDTYTID